MTRRRSVGVPGAHQLTVDPDVGHSVTASPVKASSRSADASRSSTASVWVSRNMDARPTGREVTSPQSRRQARCFETVDWASPR